MVLKDKFLSQCASDFRIKLQQLQQQDPAASLDEMIQTAISTFYKREREKEAKAQERERRKETRHAQMLAALQGSPMAHPDSLKDKARGKCLICRWVGHWASLEGGQHQNMPYLFPFFPFLGLGLSLLFSVMKSVGGCLDHLIYKGSRVLLL